MNKSGKATFLDRFGKEHTATFRHTEKQRKQAKEHYKASKDAKWAKIANE